MRCFRVLFGLVAIGFFIGCTQNTVEKRTVLAIPVYGQSLALGEEAIRITDFDSLSVTYRHTILTENLDEKFGYLSDTHIKQWIKSVLNDRRRAFELSIYGMSEVLASYLNSKGSADSLLICTFPGGQGGTGIEDLGRGSKPYKKFLEEIEKAYRKARDKGWKFEVPAFCWMQGEDDIVWSKSRNYKKDLKKFQTDLNNDIKAITKQQKDVICVTYQTNCLTLSEEFDENNFLSRETVVPQGQIELIRDDPMFMASGPTYPYSFIAERVHMDGISQKRLGYLAGLSIIRLLESKPGKGLIPEQFSIHGDTVIVKFNIPVPPLVLDTTAVKKAVNYGFSVIDSTNNNILTKVIMEKNILKLLCKRAPSGAKVRYAVNGIKGKNGYQYGPRGNLRDSQGSCLTADILNKSYPLDNWCFQFDTLVN